jgi:hypothetical protein
MKITFLPVFYATPETRAEFIFSFFSAGSLLWARGSGLRGGAGGSVQGVPRGHFHSQQQVVQAVLPLHFLPGTAYIHRFQDLPGAASTPFFHYLPGTGSSSPLYVMLHLYFLQGTDSTLSPLPARNSQYSFITNCQVQPVLHFTFCQQSVLPRLCPRGVMWRNSTRMTETSPIKAY